MNSYKKNSSKVLKRVTNEIKKAKEEHTILGDLECIEHPPDSECDRYPRVGGSPGR